MFSEESPVWICVIVALCGIALWMAGNWITASENVAHTTELATLRVENPAWPWDAIDKGLIRLGMTSDMARASWGEPMSINRSVGSWGVDEQWVYRYLPVSWINSYAYKYVYFENGILTSWSE